jgi:hypothetical protein
MSMVEAGELWGGGGSPTPSPKMPGPSGLSSTQFGEEGEGNTDTTHPVYVNGPFGVGSYHAGHPVIKTLNVARTLRAAHGGFTGERGNASETLHAIKAGQEAA